MVKKVNYDAGERLSAETQLARSMSKEKSNNLSLREEGEFDENGKKLEYSGDLKTYYKTQGLFDISIEKAIERYKEDNIEDKDAVQFIRQPLRNSTVGTEMFKEYEMYFYEQYSGDITDKKNAIVYKGESAGGWDKYYKQIKKTLEYMRHSEMSNPNEIKNKYQLYGTNQKFWFDADFFDRLFVYGMALDAYDYEDPEQVDVKSVLKDGPQTSFAQDVLDDFIEELKKKIGDEEGETSEF